MHRSDAARLAVAAETAAAIKVGGPVVALESTIVTHGMPFPQNLQMARSVEAIIRALGAIPATIAVMDGRLKVGLSGAELERLAREGHAAGKASRRDLPALLVKKQLAGTTVAATMWIAALAGIAIFATGGVGGVHRGAEATFDISADLTELASTPVAVVCAGVKSILDIAKTLETLETNGVPVYGFRSDVFPAFFARDSGYAVDHRFDEPSEIAETILLQRELGARGGVLIANPIPEADEFDFATIEARIAAATEEAEARGVSRKALTPFLLRRVNEMTDGRSLKANIALVENNARLAAKIAVALSEATRASATG
jgi:pseudouridylate synthase